MSSLMDVVWRSSDMLIKICAVQVSWKSAVLIAHVVKQPWGGCLYFYMSR